MPCVTCISFFVLLLSKFNLSCFPLNFFLVRGNLCTYPCTGGGRGSTVVKHLLLAAQSGKGLAVQIWNCRIYARAGLEEGA